MICPGASIYLLSASLPLCAQDTAPPEDGEVANVSARIDDLDGLYPAIIQ
ncbi:MAG: hypothetical protein ACI8T1_004788 [Verrucomicrobiales bacterium]|jgi:hypothetical protein